MRTSRNSESISPSGSSYVLPRRNLAIKLLEYPMKMFGFEGNRTLMNRWSGLVDVLFFEVAL